MFRDLYGNLWDLLEPKIVSEKAQSIRLGSIIAISLNSEQLKTAQDGKRAIESDERAVARLERGGGGLNQKRGSWRTKLWSVGLIRLLCHRSPQKGPFGADPGRAVGGFQRAPRRPPDVEAGG